VLDILSLIRLVAAFRLHFYNSVLPLQLMLLSLLLLLLLL